MSMIRATRRNLMALFCTSTLALAGATFGQEETSHRISLSAEVDTKRQTERTKEDKGGGSSLSRDITTETATLTIETRNGAAEEETCQLEWYFISKRKPTVKEVSNSQSSTPTPSDELVIVDSGSKSLKIPPKERIEHIAVSNPLIYEKSHQEVVNANGGVILTDTRGGDTYGGYIILVKINGEIVAQESSSTRFLKKEWLEKCTPQQPEKASSKKGKK